jgi:leucyl/phenylalanyl-tRNA---protein transferase
MFNRAPDASKVALVKLIDILMSDNHGAERMIDVQWLTPHMASLGATSMSRDIYLSKLPHILASPPPSQFRLP